MRLINNKNTLMNKLKKVRIIWQASNNANSNQQFSIS